jgi:5'-nucleotidase/UDP-sugar diphosphatase
MTRHPFRPALVALLFALAAPGPGARAAVAQPDRLVILSSTDVKGETAPCGCHIPKGGFARRASFADSSRAQFGQVLLVDNGGYFPTRDSLEDTAEFQMEAMVRLHTDAVGVADRDLRYGRSFLVSRATHAGLPVTCANLLDRSTGKPVVAPWLLRTVGNVTVGVFGLVAADADLGPSRDSLKVEDPEACARRTVEELRTRGATVIVLLSQLGKIGSEDLVVAVDGIDAVVCGHEVPAMEHGRLIKNTLACYGGDQGHYIGRIIVHLDAARHKSGGEAAAYALSPEVGEVPAYISYVKAFQDRSAAAHAKPN